MNKESWQAICRLFTVSTIMTPREEWDTITLDELTSKGKENLKFDATPIEDKGNIESFVLKDNPKKAQDITNDWTIPFDRTIPEYIAALIETKKPVMFINQEQDLIGLITPADLNKIQTRPFIYYLIGEFEIGLSQYIRKISKLTPTDILNSLSEKRKKEVIKEAEKLIKQNVNVDNDYIEFLNFSEIVKIAENLPILRKDLGFPSKKQFTKFTGGIVDLPNFVSHNVRPLIRDKYNSIKQLKDRLSRIETILEKFDEILSLNGSRPE